MKRIKARLRSRSGVSIFYALLFLMVASMVAVVILDASVTATKRARDEQRSQQATLTLTSGGKLMREMIEQSSVTVTATVDADGNELITYSGSGPFGAVLAEAVERIETYNDVFDSELRHRTIVIKTELSGAPAAIQDVTMTYTIKKGKADDDDDDRDNYVIDGTLTVAGSDEKLTLNAWVADLPSETQNPKVYTWLVKKLSGGSS